MVTGDKLETSVSICKKVNLFDPKNDQLITLQEGISAEEEMQRIIEEIDPKKVFIISYIFA